MAKGKKTDADKVTMIMSLYAVSGNVKQVARDMQMPESTVRDIIRRNEHTPEYAELRAEKRRKFADKAQEIIDLALDRLRDEIAGADSIPVNHLTTAIGILYDKKALAEGKTTENVGILSSADINKLAELAGYERR